MKIGLLGFGTVGSGFYKALGQAVLEGRLPIGEPLAVQSILVRHPERHPEVKGLLTTDVYEILDDAAIGIVVEVMGGMEPARSYILEALRRGKSVVTANKEVVAEALPDLVAACRKGGSSLYFEASVGAGIPVIQGIHRGLSANRIDTVTGVVNGTTNFILSRMTENGLDFAEALKEAQAAGYAEADPTDDIEGYDAARKAAILATIAFGSWVRPDDVSVEGITRVTAEDLAYGKSQGWVLKLVASAAQQDGSIVVQVGPVFLPGQHPLASVGGAHNAIWIEAHPVGDVMYYGLGAGSGSTASAVLGDVIEAARDIRQSREGYSWMPTRALTIGDPEASSRTYYWRIEVEDRPGTLAQVAGALSEAGISLRSVHQTPVAEGRAVLFLATHACTGKNLQVAEGLVESLRVVWAVGRPIPVWTASAD
ncbi:MAG: homoserine dehydrogenase [Thermaerobacter sp.]|nr:homoserine dehydrogenase [Thermaerobacter sp.]